MGTETMSRVQTWLIAAACVVGAPCLLLHGTATRSQASPRGLGMAISWPTTSMPLDKVLLLAAHRYQIPMSIVIAAPLERVTVPAGRYTGRQALVLIGAAVPQYAWGVKGRSVWFGSKRLVRDPNNFLNWRLPRVDLFGTVGRFIGYLAATVAAAPTVPRGFAGSSTGPLELTDPLPEVTLRNTSARAVLGLIMKRSPRFSSLIIFPRALGLTRRDALVALAGWRWVPLEAQPPQTPPTLTGQSP